MHEEYVKTVQKLNELNMRLKSRVKRCNYLKERFDANKKVRNYEQAEAYAIRINLHKPKLLADLEMIEELEDKLRSMPREWIV